MIKIGLTDSAPETKIINIRDKNQVIKAKYCIGKDDVLKHTLMEEHYIEISFELNRNVLFKRSDYIEWEGDKYTIREDYQPKQINKIKYQYTLKFEAIEMLFQDVQYYYLNQALRESEWSLTANPSYFIQIAVDNINRYFGSNDFNIGTIEPTEVKYITFSTDTNTFDALTQVAEEFDAEWYITGKTIHFVNKVSFGDEVEFETEVSVLVLSMDREEGENTTKYTRILALGSTRNIPNNYRDTTANESVDAVYTKRLRIPSSKGSVIDAYPNMSPDEVVEGTIIFDEVYPKRVGTIEAVIEDKGNILDENNKPTGETYPIFKIKDSGINFKEEYMLEELKLSMQSGDLNGRDFALIFHEKGFSKTDDSQYFEIVRTDDYGKLLPNDILKPKIGDKYVLYGFDIALVSDQYVPAGEQELFDTASTWLQKQLRDTGVYECPTVIQYFKDHQMDLAIGQKVKLIKDIDRNIINNSKEVKVNKIAGQGANLTISVDMIQGETYTLSYESTNLVVSNAYPQFFIWELGNWAKLQYLGDVSAKTRTFKFTLPTGKYTFSVYNHNYPQAGAIHKLKLEKGNKATDWSEAPEDIEGAIRSSRIQGFEKKLNNKFDATYIVGENSIYSRFGKIEQQIKELQVAGVVYENTGGSGVYVLKQFDSTRPTDFNVYSAKASDAKYFNKQTGGTVLGDTVFQKNMQVLGSAVSDVFQNSTFTAGQLGSGFQVKRDANGQSYMEIDNLMVRREAVFNRLTIAEIKSVGGSILLSLANMLVSKVENKTNVWKCFFDNSDGTIPNDFTVDDQVICRKFTGKNIKYYWSRVISVGVDFIEISKTDKDGSGVPSIDDEVIQLGNRTDVNRQSAIMLSAYGSDSPSIKQYTNINSYDLTGKEATVISPKGNKFTGSFAISTNGTTAPIYKDRDIYVNGTTYYLNDRVSYLGSYWVCIANSTIQIPNETSSVWRKDTTGTTDINNAVNNIQIGGVNFLDGSKEVKVNAVAGQGVNLAMSVDMVKGETYTLSYESTTLVVSNAYPQFFIWVLGDWTKLQYLGDVGAKSRTFKFTLPTGRYTFSVYNHNYPQAGTINKLKLEKGNKVTDWNASDADIQKDIQKVRTEYQADFKVLNNQISSKVSQSDFNTLGNRVSTTESNITQLSGSITSVVETVNNIEIGGENLLLSTKTIGSGWSYGVGTARIANDYMDLTSISGAVPTSSYLDITSYGIKNLEPDTYYTLSMWIKGQNNTDKIVTHLYASAVVSGFNSQGNKTTSSDGYILSNVSTQWKRIWITYKTRSDISGNKILLPARISSATATVGNKIFMCGFKFERGNKATDWSEAPEDTQTRISQAQTAANNAQNTANTAQINANTANGKLADISNDNLLTVSEKQDTLKEWQIIQGEYPTVTAQAATYGVSSSDYTIKYNSLNNYITSLLANMTIDSVIVGTTFRLSFKNYYDTKIALLKAITDKAKALADAAQGTADSKNRTFYEPLKPTAPSGGFKVGDLWYQTSLVDSSGNINADATKNIYQLQYRWNGTTWIKVNWSASKSKIEQTDNRITSIVESTDIDSFGIGRELKSMINQTNAEISLAVGKIQTGSNNLLNDSYLVTTKAVAGQGVNLTISENLIQGETYTLSYESTSLVVSNAYPQFFIWELGNWAKLQYLGEVSTKTRTFKFTLPTGRYTFSVYNHNYPQAGTINKLKLEKGNIATEWTLSQTDSLNEIGSKLTLTDNKISLASTTIELKGNTIAKSIEAEDLKVGSRTGSSALEVLKDGSFYAKGSTSNNSYLIIDSSTQSIEIKSPKSASGEGNSISGSSNVTISSQSGGVRVDGSTAISSNSAAIVSNSGIFANTAGQGIYAPSLAIDARASIVGLGWGNIAKDSFNDNNFVAGVYGSASNSGSAPSFGGYFNMLRANGLTLNTIIISNTSSINTNLSSSVSLVVSTSSSQRNIYLPSDAYQGTVIWFKQWYSGFMRIYPPSGYKLFDDNSENTYLDIGHGETAMCICLTDVTVSGSKIWLFGKFKF